MPMSTITVAGINPELHILGNIQQFNYSQPLTAFQLRNDFIPTALISSQFNQEISNNLLSGFRWSHITTNTDTYGSLILQSFVNAQSTGSDIMKFSSTGINILKTLNLNNTPGTSGQVLTSQGAGALPIWTTNGGDVSGVLAALYMSGNATATSIIEENAFTKVAGTTTALALNNFTSPINNKLVYTGTNTITAKVSVDLSAKPILTSTIGIVIYHNGAPMTSANYNYQLTGGKPISLTVSAPVEFVTNDHIEVYISSDYIDDVTVSNMNVIITI